MTKNEALTQALETLEFYYYMNEEEADAKAITAIKEALAQEALDRKAENARELGLNYEPENTLHWHALNYRTASTQNAQAMFEALERFVAQPEPEPVAFSCLRRVTPKKCAIHGCSPNTWPSEDPPQRKPLSYEDLIECEQLAGIRHRIHMGSIRGQQLSPADEFLWHYARAIEAAHNIKE